MNTNTSTTKKQSVNCEFEFNSSDSFKGSANEGFNPVNTPERSEWLNDPKNVKRLVKSIGATGSCTSHLSASDLAWFNHSMEELKAGLKSESWRTLEVHQKFKNEEKLALITEDKLVVGLDVASNKFDLRVFDKYGTELTVRAMEFPRSREGFDQCFNAMCELAVLYSKTQIIIGMEPTGHYWFNLYFNFLDQNCTTVMVNPYAVNRTKEIDDNLQTKSDEKDPRVIAKLVRDGSYSVPYLPEGDYAEAREYAHLYERNTEEHCRAINRLHRWTSIYFPEIETIYEQIDSAGCLLVLGKGLLPADLVDLGEEGILKLFVEQKARGKRAEMAKRIYKAACNSIGLLTAPSAARQEVIDLVSDIKLFQSRMDQYEAYMIEFGKKIYPQLESLATIPGITLKTGARFLADLGDINRFSNPQEIIKLSGLTPVLSSSGKYKGIPKISKRGRKRLRATLYIMADGVRKYDPAFAEIYLYYKERKNNPLKHKQVLMVICTKLIRVIKHLIITGEAYDPEKLLKQSKKDMNTENRKK